MTQPSLACSEHDLVAAVRAGSDRAFEELYSRYCTRISSYILRMVGDHARAEDLAQEVFISALRRIRDTERPIAFKPWIYEIAKNACIDEFRRTRRTREVPLAAGSEDDDGPSSERELRSVTPTPDAAVESKQSLADLRGAFHGLSENHHKIIVMRELEGLSYTQIGERLGMSRPMVESTLFRARRRLSEEYNELVSGRRCLQVQQAIDTTEARALRRIGIRQRRRLARHLSHCQPCRRHARMAGLDDSFFQTPSVIGKIAGLLPIPAWLRWRRGAGRGNAMSATAGSGSPSFLALRTLPTIARFADPFAPSVGAGRAAAAAVAALALAGVGGGLVSTIDSAHSTSHHPPAAAQRVVATGAASRRRHLSAATLLPIAGGSRSVTAGSSTRPRAAAAARHPSSGGPGAGRAATPSSAGPSGAPAGGARSSPITKVLSGAASTATGTATKLTGGVKLPSAPSTLRSVPGKVTSMVPKAVNHLPSPAKVLNGAGQVASKVASKVVAAAPNVPQAKVPTVTVPGLAPVRVPGPGKLLGH